MDLELPDATPDGWTVVTASGEVDVAAAPTLRDRLGGLIEAGSDRLIVDLDNVDFIDSTGLGVLVGAARRARSATGDLRVVCTNSRLLRIFEITGLDEVFSISNSVDEAAGAEAGEAEAGAAEAGD